jgi:cell division initiation protein
VKLTSKVIKNKEFRKGVRGYSQEEVEEFLDIIAQDYDAVTNEMEMLQGKVSSMEAKLSNYSKMENALQTTLVLAQDAAVQMKEKANSESERIVREANETIMFAQQEAKQILEAAQTQADRLISEARKDAAANHETAEQTLAKANSDAERI